MSRIPAGPERAIHARSSSACKRRFLLSSLWSSLLRPGKSETPRAFFALLYRPQVGAGILACPGEDRPRGLSLLSRMRYTDRRNALERYVTAPETFGCRDPFGRFF